MAHETKRALVDGKFNYSIFPSITKLLEGLRLHGLMAFGVFVVIGSVLPVHARRAWQLNKNRLSGIGMKLALAWMGGTGYALYYFSSEGNEAWLPMFHWGLGIALPLMLYFHIRLGRARHGAERRTGTRLITKYL